MRLLHGDCLEVMATLPDNSVDTIITDLPYGLEFIGKAWDKGVPGILFWAEMLRVAKPGACLMAMGGTRTYHRLASAIEDAGWRIIDMIEWLYGSGFPKSYDIGKGMDKAQGVEREQLGIKTRPDGTQRPNMGEWDYGNANDYGNGKGLYANKDALSKANAHTAPATPEAQQWDGWGTALKPAHEPICVAYKPRDGTYVENALKWGVAGLWIDGGRVYATPEDLQVIADKNGNGVKSNGGFFGKSGDTRNDTPVTGRFPANVIHDGSDEVLRGFPESNGGAFPTKSNVPTGKHYEGGWGNVDNGKRTEMGNGSAARFFYCAKASRSERNAGLEGMEEHQIHTFQTGNGTSGKPSSLSEGRNTVYQNNHPTVKPIALMEYLVRLTRTPTGGVVLDPFMGSGTTGIACVNEGRDFIGIEQSEEYLEIARRRIEYWQKQKQTQPELFSNNGHKKAGEYAK